MESRSGLFPFITFTLIAISASDAQPTATPRGPEGRGPEDRHNRVGCGVTRVPCVEGAVRRC